MYTVQYTHCKTFAENVTVPFSELGVSVYNLLTTPFNQLSIQYAVCRQRNIKYKTCFNQCLCPFRFYSSFVVDIFVDKVNIEKHNKVHISWSQIFF